MCLCADTIGISLGLYAHKHTQRDKWKKYIEAKSVELFVSHKINIFNIVFKNLLGKNIDFQNSGCVYSYWEYNHRKVGLYLCIYIHIVGMLFITTDKNKVKNSKIVKICLHFIAFNMLCK